MKDCKDCALSIGNDGDCITPVKTIMKPEIDCPSYVENNPIREKKFKEIAEYRFEQAAVKLQKCEYCDAKILWVKTRYEKWMPLQTDLKPHWGECPGQDIARSRKLGRRWG